MLTIMRKLLAYLLRIDNLDRIMVFVSIALFLVTPSYVLYWTTESNQVTDTVIRCITLIGVIAGSGVIILVRPIRTTPLYFLELLIVYSIQFSEFNPSGFDLNFVAIFWLEIIYCIIGFLVSLFSYKHYAKRKKKQTSAMNEDTNEDTIYDFLNASDANKHIEEDIENIMEQKEREKMRKNKQMKFSRLARIFSFVVSIITLLVYFISSSQKGSLGARGAYPQLVFLSMILISLIFIASLRYPRDFKYLYFYNAGFFLLLLLIISREFMMMPAFLIIAFVIVMLSFLITLIVEGRTWMGGLSD